MNKEDRELFAKLTDILTEGFSSLREGQADNLRAQATAANGGRKTSRKASTKKATKASQKTNPYTSPGLDNAEEIAGEYKTAKAFLNAAHKSHSWMFQAKNPALLVARLRSRVADLWFEPKGNRSANGFLRDAEIAVGA